MTAFPKINVLYGPGYPGSNLNGIVEYDVHCATVRLTGEEKGLVRFVVDKRGWCFYIDDMNKGFVECGGMLSRIEEAFLTPEGTYFRGWGNTKQYRLTREEVDKFLLVEGENPNYKVFSITNDLPSKVTGQTQYRGVLPC